MSRDRAGACATFPAGDEDKWRPTEGPAKWVVRASATVAYVVLIGAAHNGERGIPALAGAVGGAVIADATIAAVAVAHHISPNDDDSAEGIVKFLLVGGIVAGGVLGGVAGRELAASTGARAGVTAAMLAPAYLVTLGCTFE